MKTDGQISPWTLKQQLRLESQEGCVFKKSGEDIQHIQMYQDAFCNYINAYGNRLLYKS